MNWTGANWKRSYGDLGGEALALLDGVTLRRPVDGDWAAARATPGLLRRLSGDPGQGPAPSQQIMTDLSELVINRAILPVFDGIALLITG